MVEAQRALLDELMGVARNLTDEEKKQYREIQWDDKEVCGCYLIRFCPHDLFVNTKSDLGPCPKVHDPKLKESYESSSRYQLYIPRFEAELAQFCEKLVQDLDRKVRRGRERLAQDVDIASLVPMPAEKAEQLGTIEEKIKKLLEQIETLGEEGKVDEAQALMKKVDLLNLEKTSLMSQASSERGLVLSQEKKMALCEICGSFLVANETMERTQSHISGKQHVGFGMVRDYLVEYKEKKDKMREEEKQKGPEEGEAKEGNDLEKREENGREQNRERRDRDPVGKDRDPRDRYGDRERERHRYRDRGRGRYGRGRDLDNRNRDRNWDRDRNRERNYRRGRSRSPPNSSPGRHSSKRR